MDEFIIYGLYCPITDNIHYVGKSSVGLIRPLTHLRQSHSEKINEWVGQLRILGYVPIIKIIEVCTEDNLDDKEVFWIKKFKDDGCYLLNSTFNSSNILLSKYNNDDMAVFKIGSLIKSTRLKLDISADELAKSSGISRPTLVAIEKGSRHVIIGTFKKVLNKLGLEISVSKLGYNEITDDKEDATRVRVSRRKNQTCKTEEETDSSAGV